MIERLEATLTKYNQLQTELMSEDVLKNTNKTREISKEIADLEEVVTEYKKYTYSVKGLTDQILQFAPKSANDIAEQLKNFDVDKYSQIMEMAKGTGIQFERS